MWNISQVMKNGLGVVAKDTVRSVLGLLRNEVASNVLFTDVRLLPPPLLMDAANQCYHMYVKFVHVKFVQMCLVQPE